MSRVRTENSPAIRCPDCGDILGCVDDSSPRSSRFACPGCRSIFRVERVNDDEPPLPHASQVASEPAFPAAVGSFAIWWRSGALSALQVLYWSATLAGATLMLAFGGFIPALGAWVRDEIEDWTGVVQLLGGAWFQVDTNDPDSDLGPVLARVDAPLLFEAIGSVARSVGVRPPEQVRLSYLPCCGVVSWGRSRALLVGLPLLRVLTQAEIRSILAHELTHLAFGDADGYARASRFVEGLEQAVEEREGRIVGPLGLWARLNLGLAARLIEPLAWGQEARADRMAALVAGGSPAASALVKVAMVQPLFREVLEYYDPATAETNLYAFFRSFWFRLPEEIRSAMRMQILTSDGRHDPAHPPLPDRLAVLQSYPDHVRSAGDSSPAVAFLGDLDVFEWMLHNRLFDSSHAVEQSVFHRAYS